MEGTSGMKASLHDNNMTLPKRSGLAADRNAAKSLRKMRLVGGGNRTRTGDPLLANYSLSVAITDFNGLTSCNKRREAAKKRTFRTLYAP